MPTLLTSRKMSPELAARVLASVRGRRARPGSRLAPRSISFVRLGLVATITIAAWILIVARQRGHEQLERERGLLLALVKKESSSLSTAQKALPVLAASWLTRYSGTYTGDWIDDELRSELKFQAMLTRPSVYVRGPLATFKSAGGLAESAYGSFKDTFLLCLLAPPATRTEKALLSKARLAHAATESVREKLAHVGRLHDALVGLPYLDPAWQARVEKAEQLFDIEKLRHRFERAPLSSAKQAAKAEMLIFVIDEPGDGNGPTELDGERAHPVRVGVVDLTASKPLLSLRRRVDPSWISAPVRAEYASGIDSCSLAMDVRQGVTAPIENGG